MEHRESKSGRVFVPIAAGAVARRLSAKDAAAFATELREASSAVATSKSGDEVAAVDNLLRVVAAWDLSCSVVAAHPRLAVELEQAGLRALQSGQ